ncbi:MAG: AraC family transcriptional regulator [Chloroflexi bacterium]|nr:AraC family transcriptional regulator [Chloroflexota bacterium]
MDKGPGGAAIRAWKPPVPGIREVLHARFTDHAYPPHTHDTWTLFIVDDGAIRYDLARRPRGAHVAMVGLLPPHVVHDGRPGVPDGYRKRVLYLETSLLPERLVGPAVDRSEIRVSGLRREISQLHDRLGCHDDALEAETRLELVAERIRAALGEPAVGQVAEPGDRLADRVRAHLDAHLFEPITLAAAAEHVGSPTTLVALAFTDAFGIPPHRYLLGRRLDAARDRILRGQPLADVAAEVGFVDQAHLTRRFRQFLGITPGRFARSQA